MPWEDGFATNVGVLIDAANSTSSERRKKELLRQALVSAKSIEDDYKRKSYIALIEDKLEDL